MTLLGKDMPAAWVESRENCHATRCLLRRHSLSQRDKLHLTRVHANSTGPPHQLHPFWNFESDPNSITLPALI
jgi:hypothetical protein